MSVMVRFVAGTEAWLAPVEHVLGVRERGAVHGVPSPADGIVGLIDRDGRAWPVASALGESGRHVLLLEHDDDIVGVLTDEVAGVEEIDTATLRPRPAGQHHPLIEATYGHGSELAYVLDHAELLRGVAHTTEKNNE